MLAEQRGAPHLGRRIRELDRVAHGQVLAPGRVIDFDDRPRELRPRHSVANQWDLLVPLGIPPLDPERHALFLDFDGTFVDFAPEPDAIQLRPGAKELLKAVHERLGGAMALVSGRQVANLDRHLHPLRLPAAGVHGHELRVTRGIMRPSRGSADLGTARARLLRLFGPRDPILFEDKGMALVLHFRKAPDQATRAEELARRAAEGLGEVRVVAGNNIFEIRPTGIHKGMAVAELLQHPPFAGRLPVFVGDDTTDEDGFEAAEACGGFGVKVGEGETAARFRLTDISAVHDWLSEAAGKTRAQ
jgi:trehalose 6-phosphate phosphatase